MPVRRRHYWARADDTDVANEPSILGYDMEVLIRRASIHKMT